MEAPEPLRPPRPQPPRDVQRARARLGGFTLQGAPEPVLTRARRELQLAKLAAHARSVAAVAPLTGKQKRAVLAALNGREPVA